MADNVNINASELRRLIRRLNNPRRLRQASEIALNNAANIVTREAKQNHIFNSQSFKLENTIFKNVERNTLSIFVPVDGNLGVEYSPFIYFGKRRNPAGGADIIWPDGPDPFIDNAFERKRSEFLREYQSTLTEEINDNIG